MTNPPSQPPESFASSQQPTAIVKRDDLGFITSDQPNLSASQVQFILAAATTQDTVEAAKMVGLDLGEVLTWFNDQDFNSVYTTLLQNKREGVKQIGAQILPLMLLTLTEIMQNGSNKEKLLAIKLHAQMQGLLLTQGTQVDRGAIEALREELMRPRPMNVYRELPNAPKTNPT